MASSVLARTLFNTALKRVIKDATNIKNAASKVDTKSRIGVKGAPAYKTGVGEKKFNKTLENFSDLYKKTDGDQSVLFKNALDKIDPNIWHSFRANSKKRKLLNNKDTSRIQKLNQQTSYPQNYAGPRTLKDKRRNTILNAWNLITKGAPKIKGLPLFPKQSLGGGPFGNPSTNKMLLNMQQENPLTFPFQNIGSSQTNKLIRKLRNVDPPRPGYSGHSALKRPTYMDDINSTKAEAYLRELIPNYAELGNMTGAEKKIAKQYISELWRSREGFRTGMHSLDAHNFLKFLRKQDFLNPRSKEYFGASKEYEDYVLTRLAQPKGKDLAHDVATLNPAGKSDAPPFSGGEIGRTQFLNPNINSSSQRTKESQGLKSLLSNKKDLAKIDQKMINQNIRTTLVNPDEVYTDEELLKFYLNQDKIKQKFKNVDIEDYLSEGYYPMGGWKELGFNKGGKVDGYAAGGIGRIGIKLLAKLAKKLSPKEMKMLTGSAFKGTNPSKSLAKKREANLMKKLDDNYNWRNVKSKVPGPTDMTRRGFIKGASALAASTVAPKGILNIASKGVKNLPRFSVAGRPLAGSFSNAFSRAPFLASGPLSKALIAKAAKAAKLGLLKPLKPGRKKEFPYLDPDNDAFIVSGQSEHPVTGTPQLNKFGRYQLKSTINDTLGSDDSLFRKYSVYDWWDDITETIREKPKFKYVKDSKGNTIMKEVK